MIKLIPIAGTRMCHVVKVAQPSAIQQITTALKTLARDYFIAIGVRHV
jgi:uncharacterized radical SAM superfamily protein